MSINLLAAAGLYRAMAAEPSTKPPLPERLEQELLYLNFSNLVLMLSQREDLSEDEFEILIRRLRGVAADPVFAAREEFPYELDLVVRTVIEKGSEEALAAIEADLQVAILAAPPAIFRLVRHYGEQLIGGRLASAGRVEAATAAFQRYVDQASMQADYEQLIPLHLLVIDQLAKGREDARILALQQRASELDPARQAVLIAQTVHYLSPSFRAASARNRRIAAAAVKLVDRYRSFYIKLLDSRRVQAELNRLARRAADQGNASLSENLLAFGKVSDYLRMSRNAPEFEAKVRIFMQVELAVWLQDPRIAESIERQNDITRDYTQDQIAEFDRIWRQEIASGNHYLVREVLDRPASRHLGRVKAAAPGLYHEIFTVDAVGLIVGLTDVTSDYWQGDEPKWKQTYLAGPDSLHISEILFDESTLAWEIQISLPVNDAHTRRPIGAITVGIDPGALSANLRTWGLGS